MFSVRLKKQKLSPEKSIFKRHEELFMEPFFFQFTYRLQS